MDELKPCLFCEVHVALEDRPLVNVLRDVARVVGGFRFRIDQLAGGVPDLVVMVDVNTDTREATPCHGMGEEPKR
jgi:hypothetical protein